MLSNIFATCDFLLIFLFLYGVILVPTFKISGKDRAIQYLFP